MNAAVYLQRVTALDPRTAADELVALRDEFVHGKTAEGGADPAPQKRRKKSAKGGAAPAREVQVERLDAIRRNLLTGDPDRVGKALAAVAIDQPDLQVWHDRLRAAHRCRRELLAFERDAKLPERFRKRVLSIVLSTPEEATREKLQLLDKLSVDLVRGIVKHVRKSHPDVLQLEPDLFERIGRLKKDRSLARSGSFIAGGFFTIWIVLQVIRAITRAFTE